MRLAMGTFKMATLQPLNVAHLALGAYETWLNCQLKRSKLRKAKWGVLQAKWKENVSKEDQLRGNRQVEYNEVQL